MGAADSGLKISRFCLSHGKSLFLSDAAELEQDITGELGNGYGMDCIETYFGDHPFHFIDQADLVIRSTGIPEDENHIRYAEEKGTPVCSTMEFAAHFCKAPLFIVTGSVGKTTTLKMFEHFIVPLNANIFISDRIIGRTMADALCDKTPYDLIISELSILELTGSRFLSPDFLLITNLHEDSAHIEQFVDFAGYVQAKLGWISSVSTPFRIIALKETFEQLNRVLGKNWAGDLCIKKILEQDNPGYESMTYVFNHLNIFMEEDKRFTSPEFINTVTGRALMDRVVRVDIHGYQLLIDYNASSAATVMWTIDHIRTPVILITLNSAIEENVSRDASALKKVIVISLDQDLGDALFRSLGSTLKKVLSKQSRPILFAPGKIMRLAEDIEKIMDGIKIILGKLIKRG